MSSCFGVISVYALGYVMVYVLVIFLYVHMYVDVNNAIIYVIRSNKRYGCHVIMMLCCKVSSLFASQQVDYCKYCNELSYKAPSIVYFAYNNFVVIGVFEH